MTYNPLPELKRIEELEAEVKQLQAIEKSLPKTADGVSIIAAPDLHEVSCDGTIVKVTGWYLYSDGVWGVRIRYDGPRRANITHLVAENRVYSSREAAEAAGGR